MEILEGLDAAQREAVTSTEGCVRVVAGAGSGKTRALTRRFAYLVSELGVLPENILCVTFTNKSAGEMRRRINQLIGDAGTGLIGTFHSFCVTVLQEESHAVGYPKSFLVLDNGDINAMLADIYEERGLTMRHMTFGSARDMIEIRKLKKEPDYYKAMLEWPLEELQRRYLDSTDTGDIIFYGYIYQQKKCFGLDYNDLLTVTLYIFSERAEIRKKWQERLEYIMIDEFQDIDDIQYKLMRVLAGYHGNIFVVGDPDQTIYTWRGADVKFLMELDKAFPGTKTVMMNNNYRSTPEIIAAANSLISRNRTRIDKSLVSMREGGRRVLCHRAATGADEAAWIVSEIKRLREEGAEWRDIAVLYRAHYVTRAVEEVLLKEGVPYALYSGAQFYERAEIKDALSYLRLVIYRDDLSFLRVANKPKRNLGQRRMAAVKERAIETSCSLYDALVSLLDDGDFKNTKARQLAALVEDASEDVKRLPVSDVLTELLSRSGYEAALRTEGDQARLDNLAELLQAVREYEVTCGEETTPEAYLSRVALLTDLDRGERREAVRLMTVHAAKGLEFPHVFLCGLDEGIFPSRKVRDLPGMEEERRLCFVALTRAEDALYLSGSDGRTADGSPKYPSRFVLDIDRSLLDFTSELPESLVKETSEHIAAAERRLEAASNAVSFPPGARVLHPVLGAGTVLAEDTEARTRLIKFDDLPTPRKIAARIELKRV